MTVFAVLKIIGLVLLFVLGVVLALLLLILFVPVRYSVDAQIEETDFAGLKDRVHIRAGVSWLLHILRCRFVWPGGQGLTVKLLFFRLPFFAPDASPEDGSRAEDFFAAGEAEEDETEEAGTGEAGTGEAGAGEAGTGEAGTGKAATGEAGTGEGTSAAHTAAKASPDQGPSGDGTPDTGHSDAAEPSSRETASRDSHAEAARETAAEDAWEDAPETRRKPTPANFLRTVFRMLRAVPALLVKPYHVFQKIRYTISCIYGKIHLILRLLETESFERARDAVLKQLRAVLRSVSPRRSDVRLTFGTGDPADTAKILGIRWILYPLAGDWMRLEADFERQVVGGTVKLRGRITVFRLLLSAAMLYFNRDVRRTYARLRKILR